MDQSRDAQARPGSAPTGRRPDASMSLLTDVMANPVDPSYAAAAARRPADAGPARPGRLAVVGAVVVALVLTVAAVQVRERAAATSAARSALVEEVERRTRDADRLERDLEQVRADIARLRRDALPADGAGAELDRLETLAGGAPVEGPGLVVTVDDAGGGGGSGDPRGEQSDADERVLDRDLQAVVNALWAAGAEAVSVNDQRLTSLTAIRSAGDAILVGYRPIVPPYVVRAVGDAEALERSFVTSRAGREMRLLADNYGFRFEVARAEKLRLPASGGLTVRVARPVSPSPAASGTPARTPGTSQPTKEEQDQ